MKGISISSVPNSKIMSLLYEISQLHSARKWESTEEKYDCMLDRSPYTLLISIIRDSILDRFCCDLEQPFLNSQKRE